METVSLFWTLSLALNEKIFAALARIKIISGHSFVVAGVVLEKFPQFLLALCLAEKLGFGASPKEEAPLDKLLETLPVQGVVAESQVDHEEPDARQDDLVSVFFAKFSVLEGCQVSPG